MNWNKVKASALSGDALESIPVNIDWQEAFKDYGERNEAFEAKRCETCGKVYSGSTGQELECTDESCKGYVGLLDGPMMNYFYPVDFKDEYRAAEALVDLPLCAVRVDDQTGIALTGGGMDLSWEICAAFIALGFLPPVHFASSLPRMAQDLGPRERAVIRCAKYALQIQVKRAQGGLRDLKRTVDYYRLRESQHQLAQAESKRLDAEIQKGARS